MRVALFADVHGNDLALKAVLDDIRHVGVDATYCLGDVASLGPSPRDAIDTLAQSGCTCIAGNHDEMVLDPSLARQYTGTKVVLDAIDWCADQLSAYDQDFLRSLASECRIDLEGRTVLGFHGTPRSNVEDLVATTPPELVDEFLDGRKASVIVGGHTHVHMIRQHRGTLLVNVGSVGLPFREYVGGGLPVIMLDRAEYAIVEGVKGGPVTASLRSVPIDGSLVRHAVEQAARPVQTVLLEAYSA
jgi:putative phosphoesterase